MTQSLDLITKNSTRHISNNHKSLKFNQMKDLKEVITEVSQILRKAEQTFKNKEFSSLDEIIRSKRELLALVDAKIDRQVKRTKDDEQSPKNTTLYFSLLLETRDLIETTMQVVEEYYIQYDKKVDLE